MKKLVSQFVSFLSYHNAVPIAFGVLFLGGASVFAATATGVLPLPAPSAPQPEPVHVDTSALLSANLDTFAFSPTVTNVVETDTEYAVSYSLRTLAPQGDAWAPFTKTGEFSVAKSALPDTGLQGYVVQKLQDIENGERSYLARSQDAERELAAKQQAQPASAFASLVGLALNQIPVPVVEKPAPAPQQEAPPAQNAVTQTTDASSAAASSADTATSTLDATSDATTTTATISATSSPQTATSTVVASTTPATSSAVPTAPDTAAPASSATSSTTPTSTELQSAASDTSNASSQSDAIASSAESTATVSP